MLLNVKLETVPALLASATADLIPVNAIDQLSGCPFPDSVPATPKKQNPQKKCCLHKQGRRKESGYQCGDFPKLARTFCCPIIQDFSHPLS